MIDTIYWNNFFTYQWLILLYYFHQKILKRKMRIFKSCNFFNRTCFLHSGNQVFAYQAYIFTSLTSRFISIESNHVCIIYAWIMHLWIVQCWIVYHELAQPLFCHGFKRDALEHLIYVKLILVFTPNLKFPPYSELILGSTTFKLMKGDTSSY